MNRIGFSLADAHNTLQRTVARLIALGSPRGVLPDVLLALRKEMVVAGDLSERCHGQAKLIVQAADILRRTEDEACRQAEALPDFGAGPSAYAGGDAHVPETGSILDDSRKHSAQDDFPTFFPQRAHIIPKLNPTTPYFRAVGNVPHALGVDSYWANTQLVMALEEAEAAFVRDADPEGSAYNGV